MRRVVLPPPHAGVAALWPSPRGCAKNWYMEHHGPPGPISVFLADDNLIVREGVRALINARKDLQVVGVAADFDELIGQAAKEGCM